MIAINNLDLKVNKGLIFGVGGPGRQNHYS